LLFFVLSYSPGGARVFCFIVPAGTSGIRKAIWNIGPGWKNGVVRAFLFSFSDYFEMGYGFFEGDMEEIWG
jgi:hypothetical protein